MVLGQSAELGALRMPRIVRSPATPGGGSAKPGHRRQGEIKGRGEGAGDSRTNHLKCRRACIKAVHSAADSADDRGRGAISARHALDQFPVALLRRQGLGLITTTCTRGQIGPLRNCGFGTHPTTGASSENVRSNVSRIIGV